MTDFINNGLDLIKIIIIYEIGLGLERRIGKKNYCVASIGYIIVSLIMNYLPDEANPLDIYTIFIIFETMILYKEKIIVKIFLSLWAMGAVGVVDGVIHIVLEMFVKQQSFLEGRITKIVVSLITILIFTVLFKKLGKSNSCPLKYIKVRHLIYIFLLGVINEVAIAIMLGFSDYYKNEPAIQEKIVWLSIVFVAALFFQFAFVLQLASTNRILKEKEQVVKKSLKMQEEYYVYLEKKDKETRKFRHDIRKHFYVLEKLGRDGQYKKQQEYLQTMIGKVDEQKNCISVKNEIVDAILNRYMEISKEESFFLRVEGSMPEICYIEAYDLCTIYANLLENAIEAVRIIEDKKIMLTIRHEENMIFIREENPYKGIINSTNGYIKTTKKEQKIHGYGMKNMEESIQKYQGTMTYHTENGKFIVEIILYNKKA